MAELCRGITQTFESLKTNITGSEMPGIKKRQHSLALFFRGSLCEDVAA
jgi:hypothetical protein